MAESIPRPGARLTIRLAAMFAVCALAIGLSVGVSAHDIPASVVVQTFARPEGQRLRFMVRLPLVAIRDFVFPSTDGVTLDLARVEPMLSDMARTWLVPAVTVFENNTPVGPPQLTALRIALPSDRAFSSYDDALAHFRSPPLETSTVVPTSAALFDVMFEYPISSDRSRFSIDPHFARFGVRVVTTLQFMLPGQPERAFQFTGDPGVVDLDPHWYQAAARFVRAGFAHILSGIDHLLFLVCLVLPLRRFWSLVKVVTAFTVAHSITLACAAFGFVPDAVGFPALVEFLIALSIVYMAVEDIVIAVARRSATTNPQVREPAALHRRWAIAFGFGLIHGFGFSFALKETLQFAGSHLVTSLVSFNLGVELGQVAVLIVVLPLLALVFRYVVAEWLGIILASAIVAHTAWHWLIDRGRALTQYDWSVSDPAGLASLLRWVMVVVAIAGAAWLVSILRNSKSRQ
jgi:hypothetical protein